jgi:hypothetical protein
MLLIENLVLNVISTYTHQIGLDESVKRQFRAEMELDQRCKGGGANDKTILKMFKFKASFTLNVYQQVLSKEVIFHLIL